MSKGKPSENASQEKQQLESAVGIELLNLCQSITADGVVSKEEIIALTRWLRANREQDIPVVQALAATVERIVEDQRVSRAERKELYAEIAKVLPLHLRKSAVTNRRHIEERKKERAQAIARAKREADKALTEEERLEKERNRPIGYFDFMVAGVHHEGRHKAVNLYAHVGDSVRLIRENANQYSRNAVRIELENGSHIGYVPEDEVEEMTSLMEDRLPFKAEIKKIHREGSYPIPVILAIFFSQDSDLAAQNQPEETFESFWNTLFDT